MYLFHLDSNCAGLVGIFGLQILVKTDIFFLFVVGFGLQFFLGSFISFVIVSQMAVAAPAAGQKTTTRRIVVVEGAASEGGAAETTEGAGPA